MVLKGIQQVDLQYFLTQKIQKICPKLKKIKCYMVHCHKSLDVIWIFQINKIKKKETISPETLLQLI